MSQGDQGEPGFEETTDVDPEALGIQIRRH